MEDISKTIEVKYGETISTIKVNPFNLESILVFIGMHTHEGPGFSLDQDGSASMEFENGVIKSNQALLEHIATLSEGMGYTIIPVE